MRGLPGRLPEGERVLWQGSPDWRAMTRRVFHLRALGAYFAVLLAYSAAHAFGQGAGAGAIGLSLAKFGGLALVPLLLLTCYAWGNARVTVYTVTNRRVAIRMGIAMPLTLNLPFARIDGAAFHGAKDGTGDIALQLTKGDRIAYLVLWPHARPWRLGHAQPMLRAVANGEKVAAVLSRALAAAADAPVPAMAQLHGANGAATMDGAHTHAAAAA